MRDELAALPLLLVLGCSGPVGAERSGTSGAAVTDSPATISFTADWTESTTALVAGQTARIAYDPARLPQCRGTLGYGGNEPAWSIDAGYMVNGIYFGAPVGVAGLSLQNEHLPPGALPSLTLPFAGQLEMWFSNTSAFGCSAWDSNYGANFAFTITAPDDAPGWVGNASILIDRATCGSGGPCYGDAKPAAATGAVFDTWARQQAAITELFFDVWKAGVTDFDNPDLWQQLDVEAHHRVDPSAPFTMDYVSFAERTGNNARYAENLRPLDPLSGVNGGPLTSAGQCPAIPATITADGQYVQVDMEIFFTVNGVAVQPGGGGAFHVLFQNYAGLYSVCPYPKSS